MSTKNMLLPFIAISLLGASSISFTMDTENLEKENNMQRLHEILFKSSRKEPAKSGRSKMISTDKDHKFVLLEKYDGTKALLTKENDGQKYEEVSSFKFNQNGTQIFLRFGEKSVLVDLKQNKSFAIKRYSAQDTDYDSYGFTTKDKHIFVTTHNGSKINIFDATNGERFGDFDLMKHEIRNPEAIKGVLSGYTTNPTFNAIVLAGRNILLGLESDTQDFKNHAKRAFNMTTDEEEANIQRL